MTVYFDPDPNKSKVFANLHFTYLVRSRIEGKLNTKIKQINRLVNTKQTADGKIVISDCIAKVQESCSADQRFLSRFSSSGFDIPKKEGLPSGYNTQLGAEYTHKSSHIFKAPYVGEYCLSHSICNNNQWISNTLCYDSCQNKFWTDGLNTYVNKKTLNTIKDTYICKDKNLTFNNTTCAEQVVSSIDLPKGQYNQNKSIIKTITDSSNKTIGKAEFIFQCSYAGTWQLKYATCKQVQDPKKPNLFTVAWDIKATANNPELLCTSNHTLDIKTHDYATSNKTQNINLNMLYKDQTFPIGTPKRIIFGFSSATIACKSNNKWQQIGDTSLNCEGFLKEKSKLVDILFVVDDSGSMEDEQVKLGQAVNDFLEEFFKIAAHNIDYRIAVITTAYHHSDKDFKIIDELIAPYVWRNFVSSKRKNTWNYFPYPYPAMFKKQDYTGSEPELKQQLKQALQPGTSRSIGNELSFLSAHKFIKKYKTSFLRQKALMAIFFLTDEDNLENNPDHDRNLLTNEILNFKNNDKNLIFAKSATANIAPSFCLSILLPQILSPKDKSDIEDIINKIDLQAYAAYSLGTRPTVPNGPQRMLDALKHNTSPAWYLSIGSLVYYMRDHLYEIVDDKRKYKKIIDDKYRSPDLTNEDYENYMNILFRKTHAYWKAKKKICPNNRPIAKFVTDFNGIDFDINDSSYGKQMAAFAEEITKKALIFSK